LSITNPRQFVSISALLRPVRPTKKGLRWLTVTPYRISICTSKDSNLGPAD